MDPTIIAALIGVAGVALTAGVSFWIYKRQSWATNVSNERVQWLKDFRKEVGEIAEGVLVAKSLGAMPEPNKSEVLCRAEAARLRLISRLNTNDVENNPHTLRLKEILFSLDLANGNAYDEQAYMRLVNLILEEEWAKVKKETKR